MLWRFQNNGSALRRTVSFTGAVKYPPASVDLRSMHRFCSKVRDQP
jgi:hypothetical protein